HCHQPSQTTATPGDDHYGHGCLLSSSARPANRDPRGFDPELREPSQEQPCHGPDGASTDRSSSGGRAGGPAVGTGGTVPPARPGTAGEPCDWGSAAASVHGRPPVPPSRKGACPCLPLEETSRW